MFTKGLRMTLLVATAGVLVLLVGAPATVLATTNGQQANNLSGSTLAASRQLARARHQVATAPHSASAHRHVLQASWRIIRLNRSLLRFNDAAQATSSAALCKRAEHLNLRIAALDARMLQLQAAAHIGPTATADSAVASVRNAKSTVSSSINQLLGKARTWADYWHKKRAQPASTPTPTPTPTPTTTPKPTPTPTVTPKPTPTPTPTPTVTPTPTPTPNPSPTLTPTPSPTPTAAATTMGHLVLNGAHDVTYNNVTFDGAGGGNPDVSGVIEISGNSYNITFVNCTIDPNRDGQGNGVKIVDGGKVHDVTFQNCHFLTQPRMGFECIGRGSGGGYARVNLIGCTFEPQGSEAISYDDDSGYAGSCLISGNLVKGAGTNSAFSWGQGFEINGVANMTVSGNTFDACRGDIWNLNGPSGKACGWVFSNNTINAAVKVQSVPMGSSANAVCASNVRGGTFAGNSITSAAPGGGIAWLNGCQSMDWRTTSWHDARGGSYATPQQVNCSGNQF